jgi:C-terminal processing protease CtpA/Prc
MRFKIEYLHEATEASSVCHTRSIRAREAQAWARDAKTKFGASGFQIRWMEDRGRIVCIEAFDDAPAWRH